MQRLFQGADGGSGVHDTIVRPRDGPARAAPPAPLAGRRAPCFRAVTFSAGPLTAPAYENIFHP
ncbi:hypothetical protein GCM10010358_17350 [Streptomyces minutiscleroticus]|uniref:Uncharacterized protein n=1 Tax=Streptomyces minutiscleroticus TaxID=68238 RepID=A0A918NE16_9ACTN|nr:hypothetical protein GCM10010358_17350 [Streptomyces minutiscleroticus]